MSQRNGEQGSQNLYGNGFSSKMDFLNPTLPDYFTPTDISNAGAKHGQSSANQNINSTELIQTYQQPQPFPQSQHALQPQQFQRSQSFQLPHQSFQQPHQSRLSQLFRPIASDSMLSQMQPNYPYQDTSLWDYSCVNNNLTVSQEPLLQQYYNSVPASESDLFMSEELRPQPYFSSVPTEYDMDFFANYNGPLPQSAANEVDRTQTSGAQLGNPGSGTCNDGQSNTLPVSSIPPTRTRPARRVAQNINYSEAEVSGGGTPTGGGSPSSSHSSPSKEAQGKSHGWQDCSFGKRFKAEKPRADKDHPWVRINSATKGKSTRSGKINNYKGRYSKVGSQFRAWNSSNGFEFKYNSFGELEKLKLTAQKAHDFIYEHPENDSHLILWIQRTPADSVRRYDTQFGPRCRFKHCPEARFTSNIGVGQFRVAWDERWAAWGAQVDPFEVSGYAHLYCMERFLDFADICAKFDVRVDDRELYTEPNGKFGASLARQAEVVVAKKFVKACKKGNLHVKFPNYPMHEPDAQGAAKTHEGTLTYAMSCAKIGAIQPSKMRKFEERGIKPSHMLVHKGNLEVMVEGKVQIHRTKHKVKKEKLFEKEEEEEAGEEEEGEADADDNDEDDAAIAAGQTVAASVADGTVLSPRHQVAETLGEAETAAMDTDGPGNARIRELMRLLEEERIAAAATITARRPTRTSVDIESRLDPRLFEPATIPTQQQQYQHEQQQQQQQQTRPQPLNYRPAPTAGQPAAPSLNRPFAYRQAPPARRSPLCHAHAHHPPPDSHPAAAPSLNRPFAGRAAPPARRSPPTHQDARLIGSSANTAAATTSAAAADAADAAARLDVELFGSPSPSPSAQEASAGEPLQSDSYHGVAPTTAQTKSPAATVPDAPGRASKRSRDSSSSSGVDDDQERKRERPSKRLRTGDSTEDSSATECGAQ